MDSEIKDMGFYMIWEMVINHYVFKCPISLSYPNPVLNQTKSRTKYQSLGLTLLNARSSQNQQMGVSQPWGKSPGQNASQEGDLCPIKLCDVPQDLGNNTQKKNISLVWSGVFEQFKNPESTVWCALALEQGSRSLALLGGQTMAIQRSKDWGFRIFSGGYLFGVFILACCQHNILINRCPPPVLGHHPFLVIILYTTS